MTRHKRHKKAAGASRKSAPRAVHPIKKSLDVPEALERDALGRYEDEGGLEPEEAAGIPAPTETEGDG